MQRRPCLEVDRELPDRDPALLLDAVQSAKTLAWHVVYVLVTISSVHPGLRGPQRDPSGAQFLSLELQEDSRAVPC